MVLVSCAVKDESGIVYQVKDIEHHAFCTANKVDIGEHRERRNRCSVPFSFHFYGPTVKTQSVYFYVCTFPP